MSKKQIDEAIEDDLDLEDDDFMKEYQSKRIAEMKEASMAHKFNGSVYDITKQDYEWHVNNMPPGTMGIIHLYQDYIIESACLKEIMKVLAAKHPTRKWMQIQATKCVEDYQDVDVPALLFYKDGKMFDQLTS